MSVKMPNEEIEKIRDLVTFPTIINGRYYTREISLLKLCDLLAYYEHRINELEKKI